MSNIIQLNERITFTHKGINIYLDLDYEKGEVSFVEKNGVRKDWLFAERGREYLSGWYLILEAMQKATEYADTRLKEQQEARDNLQEAKIVNLMVALSGIKESK